MAPQRAKVLSLTIIPLSTLLLLLIFILSSQTLTLTKIRPHTHTTSHLQLSLAATHCSGTLYPDLCVSTLSTIPDLHTKSLAEIISTAVNRTFAAVHESSDNCSAFLHRPHLDSRQQIALTDCLDLLGTTVDYFRYAIADLSSNASSHTANINTVLSAAITNQYTCLDGFAYVKGRKNLRPALEGRFYHISKLVSNALALAKKIDRRQRRHPHRGTLEGFGRMVGEFPSWVKETDRRMLATVVNGTTANLVVAQDGSGNFTTVGAAVAVAPNNSATRFVIYIKAGAYFENVEVGKKQINLMFVGDGIGKTVIKASRNVVDGWTTFRSATVAITGNNFLARDITIENAAGASKHQAVALRVSADLTAFYRCSFVGYQDTLYVHTLRQFYRECDIYGTVDFIFGNAAVVFQNCNLYARRPDPNQQNIFTAQGREDPNQNTGISIHNCKVAAAADLIPVQSNFSSYLGRPWKQYSRTVYLQSQLDDVVAPAGWLPWNGSFALDTLFYGEYNNRGPGANTNARVTWPGYRVINSSAEASNFTVANFIQGDVWLAATVIPFTSGLT